MSSSRIFLVGNSIFRPHKPSFPLSFNRFPSVSLRFRCFSSDAAAAVATTVDSDSPSLTPHPWPEWITFVDRLKTKGYFTKDTEDDTVYQEMILVKDACLSFARDRYDVLRYTIFSNSSIFSVETDDFVPLDADPYHQEMYKLLWSVDALISSEKL